MKIIIFLFVSMVFAPMQDFQNLPIEDRPLAFEDYENDVDMISTEPFVADELVIQYPANSRYFIMKLQSFIDFVQDALRWQSRTFKCPMTRAIVPFAQAKKYRLKRSGNQLPSCTCPSYETRAVSGTKMCQFGKNCALASGFRVCPDNSMPCALAITTTEQRTIRSTRKPQFPDALTTFNTNPVDAHFFRGQSLFRVASNADLDIEGALWYMKPAEAMRLGFKERDAHVMGQWSPRSRITLTADVREELGIPPLATHFVWSYPIVGGLPQYRMNGMTLALKSFLNLGGFLYIDSQNRPLSALMLNPVPSRTEGGLQFGKPLKWKLEWTKQLQKHGRFQEITLQPLRDTGAFHFCWIRPGEIIGSADNEQPQVKHGAFAYIFSEDLFQDAEMNRYFPVVDKEEGWNMEESDGESDSSTRIIRL